ncbi:MAG: hypothetical protein IJA34_00485 [Lachnospiraceae bacterium]|nr:hypothetical protein [Lachnospiraceae bacterium]
MAKFIKNWEDLVGLESENYKLEIDLEFGSGWIVPKVETKETEKDYYKHHFYLSTHTFYGCKYKYSTEILQKFGFDVILDNWDK